MYHVNAQSVDEHMINDDDDLKKKIWFERMAAHLCKEGTPCLQEFSVDFEK